MGPGIMNIQVRVLAANARRTLRSVRAEMAAVQAQSQATSAVSPVGKRSFADMTKAGNQMQWVGRQLQYNFTLPLVLAGAAATKFALDQQAAMVHVAKVYGDSDAAVKSFQATLDAGGEQAKNLRSEYSQVMGKDLTGNIEAAKKEMAAYNQEIEKQELAALERNFDALSVKFAIQKKEVMEVAGAWAAAGVSGKELAKSVENTLIATNIGDMPAAKATEALISIQAQYNMSASKLKRTLADLNAIENATAVDMGGLIQSMAKSGSAAAASGTSAKYLAAMTASITPAAGSASQAGNALKTILSRISKPTEEGAAAMERLGVNVDSVAWKSLGGAEKLEVLQKGFNNLSESEQLANASATVGIYQYNRYIQLLKDMGREHGNYNKSLDATISRDKVFNTMNKELGTILESNPKRLQRMGIALQNSLADIITPLIPQLIYLAGEVANLAKAFNNLPAGVQKVALGIAVLLVVMPLLLRYLGSLKTLFVVTKIGVGGLARAIGILSTATAVNTVIDGESVVVTEMKRKGLIGLFLTMLRAPFKWFAAAAWASATLTSKAFTFIAWSGVTSIRMLIARTAAPFAAWVAFLTQTVLMGGFAAAFKWVWASIVGLFARGSATTLAITRGTNAALVAGNVTTQRALAAGTATGAAAQISIWSRFGGIISGIMAATRLRLAAIWLSFIGFLANPAAIMAALKAVSLVIGQFAVRLIPILFGPWGIAIGAIIGLLYIFRSQIAQVWNNIVSYFQSSGDLGRVFNWMVGGALSAFNALPQGVQNAMLAVVKVVRDAALAVYEWFSYINPFAHHSPSLVENVTAGMGEVVKQFSTLGQIKQYTDAAYKELNRFGKATSNITGKSARMDVADDRKTLQKGGASKAALKSYDDLQGKLRSMRSEYAGLGAEIDRLKNKDIEARREMDHAIFENEFAQKKLRLEMLRMEQGGISIDKVKDQLSGLDDEIKKVDDRFGQLTEAIDGMKEITTGLRAAGAGSDITGFYDEQLKALEGQRAGLDQQKAGLEAQKKPLEDSLAVLDKMSAQMENLQRQGEILDLEKAMKFDEVDHQIDRMQQKYDLIGETISDIEAGISAAVTAQENLNRAAEERKQAKEAAKNLAKEKGKGATTPETAGANFPDVTGKGLKGRTDFSSEVDAINALTDETLASTSDLFAQVNPFKSMGKWFKKTWDNDVLPTLSGAGDWVGNFFSTIFDGVKLPDSVTNTGNFLGNAFDPKEIKAKVDAVVAIVTGIFDLFWPDLKRIFTAGWNGLVSIWDQIGPELVEFATLLAPLKDALIGTAKVVGGVLVIAFGILLAALKVVGSVIGHTIGPVFEAMGGVIAGFLKILRGAIRIVAGAVKVIMGLLTLDPKMVLTGLGDIGKGIWEVFSGLLNTLGAVFKGAWQILVGIAQGIVGGIFGFFKWLYDLLPTQVHDTVNAVIGAFQFLAGVPQWIWENVLDPVFKFFANFFKDYILPVVDVWWNLLLVPFAVIAQMGIWFWDHVLKPVIGRFKDAWDWVVGHLKGWWGGIQNALSAVKGAGQWFWNNVLSPIVSWVGRTWSEHIQPKLASWWGGITGAFDSLKGLGQWVWNNVLKPIKDKFEQLFNDIKTWIGNNTSKIVNPMIGMVNGIIGAINKMIDGLMMLNKLPGINFKVDHIPPIKALEEGGAIPNRRVGNGWVTNGARAIVGEGKPNHPEFVIPTDPTYRNRATMLFNTLGQKLGLLEGKKQTPLDNVHGAMNDKGVPMFFGGGILDGIKKTAGGIKNVAKGVTGTVINVGGEAFDWAKGAAGNVASRIYTPVGKIVDRIIGKLWNEIQPGARTAHTQVKDVVFGTDEYMEQLRKEIADKWVKPLMSGYSIGGGIGSYAGHNGRDFPVAKGTSVHAISGGTVTASRDIAANGGKYNGGGYGSYGRMIEIAHKNGIKSLYAHNSQRLVSAGDTVMPNDVIAKSGSTGNSSGPHLHLSMWQNGSLTEPLDFLRTHGVKLAKGAIVRSRSGGVDATIGEGNRDEAVLPLPRGWRGDDPFRGGDTNITVTGDLVFPNVENGDDAEDFINNLVSVVKE